MQNRAIFDRKIARFRRRTRAQHTTNAHRSILRILFAMRHTLATVCTVFASAGRVSRAKMAPNRIEIFGNSTEKRRFLSRNACQQRQRSSEKAAHRVLRACNDALVCLSGFARESVAVMALIFKFLHAKSRDLGTFHPVRKLLGVPFNGEGG